MVFLSHGTWSGVTCVTSTSQPGSGSVHQSDMWCVSSWLSSSERWDPGADCPAFLPQFSLFWGDLCSKIFWTPIRRVSIQCIIHHALWVSGCFVFWFDNANPELHFQWGPIFCLEMAFNRAVEMTSGTASFDWKLKLDNGQVCVAVHTTCCSTQLFQADDVWSHNLSSTKLFWLSVIGSSALQGKIVSMSKPDPVLRPLNEATNVWPCDTKLWLV